MITKKDSYYQELEKEGFYETIDKRSKDYREYKEWLAKKDDYNALKENVEQESTGLGDTIAKITKATGIEKLVNLVTGEKDCGCDDRKRLLNKMFNYKKPNCIEEDDYNYLSTYFSVKRVRVEHSDKQRLVDIYNFIFNEREDRNTSCGRCVNKVVENLKRYLEAYK